MANWVGPVDQGFEHGPGRSFAANPPAYDPLYHFQLAIWAGCNAYAAPLGFLEAGAADFAGQVPLILKLNGHDNLATNPDPLGAQTASECISARSTVRHAIAGQDDGGL
jgi:fructose-bisphosphate aldolase, class I